MSQTYTTIGVEVKEQVGMLMLNRPEQLNALNSTLMTELSGALQAMVADDAVACIVLGARGRSFSAGFDLKESAEKNYASTPDWARVIRADFDFVMQFWECPKPTIAAVHGHCLAGGLELAVACDVTVADTTAQFGEPEARFGSAIVALVVPWLIGPKFAKELLLSGTSIDARRAYEIGLINRVVPEGEDLRSAFEVARAMATASALSVRMTKQAINRSMNLRGMRESLLSGVDTAVIIESSVGPERAEFNRIRAAEGLNAAIAWRTARGG